MHAGKEDSQSQLRTPPNAIGLTFMYNELNAILLTTNKFKSGLH